MKKTLLSVSLLLLWAHASRAQSLPGGSTEETYVMSDRGIIGTMELDTTQRRRLIMAERHYDQAFDRLMVNDTLEDNERALQADHLAKGHHHTLRTILTTEQYQHWARMMSEAVDD